MSFIIALAGKGGTGKTTLAALTIRYIIEKKKKPVLAVDADPNSCLNEALGVKVHTTIGKIREESLNLIRNNFNRPGGMSTEELFDYQVQQSLIESKGFDLIVMGRPEGPGCYCAANNIIRKYTDKLSLSYSYVVIDNEAGMEHLSRRTTHRVNLLMIVSDPSIRGVHTAKRINELIDELNLNVEKRVLIINRVLDGEGQSLKKYSEDNGLFVAGFIPNDSSIFNNDLNGKPVINIPSNSNALSEFFKVLDTLNIP